MPEVSYATSIGVGLVGPKPREKSVGDGQQVNIPAPFTPRFKTQGGRRKIGGAHLLDMVTSPNLGHALAGKSTRAL